MKIGNIIDAHISKKRSRGPPRNKEKFNIFHPSSAGNCMRQSWFRKMVPMETDAKSLRIFEIGHIFHDYLEKVLPGKSEVPIHMEIDDIIIKGHIDQLLPDNTVVDFKTASDVKYHIDAPSPANVEQINIYMKAVSATKGKLVYVDKRNLDIVEHDVSFDETMFQESLTKFKTLLLLFETGTRPERPKDMVRYYFPCQYCEYKDLCWDEDNNKKRIGDKNDG